MARPRLVWRKYRIKRKRHAGLQVNGFEKHLGAIVNVGANQVERENLLQSPADALLVLVQVFSLVSRSQRNCAFLRVLKASRPQQDHGVRVVVSTPGLDQHYEAQAAAV